MTPEYICSLESCDRPVAEDGGICQTCLELRDDDLVAEFMQAVEDAKPGKPIVDWFQALMHNGLHAVPQAEDPAGYKRLVFEGPSSRLVLNPRRIGDAFNASVTHLSAHGASEWTVLFDVNVPASVVLDTLQSATNPHHAIS
jgi:hypothetical protein